MRFHQVFARDFHELLREVLAKPVCLFRFGPGEHALLTGLPYRAQSGWTVRDRTWMSDELDHTFEWLTQRPQTIVGFSAPTVVPYAAAYYRKRNGGFKIERRQTTFAEIFQYSNYRSTPKLLSMLPFVKVVSPRPIRHPWSKRAKIEHIQVPEDCVRNKVDLSHVWEQILKPPLQPVLVVAGPASKIILRECWERDQSVTMLDVGSFLDPSMYGKATRPWHTGSSLLLETTPLWDPCHDVSPEPAKVKLLQKLLEEKENKKPGLQPMPGKSLLRRSQLMRGPSSG